MTFHYFVYGFNMLTERLRCRTDEVRQFFRECGYAKV